MEKELSLKKQFLDIVIVRKQYGAVAVELPVGLDNLAAHNLLTYKLFQESLSSWTIEELIGYYSNYRKIISPSLNKLLPVEDFQLYAISTRYPRVCRQIWRVKICVRIPKEGRTVKEK